MAADLSKLPERLSSKVEIMSNGCWEWRSLITGSGYAYVHWEGSCRRAVRVIYKLLVGPIPEGLELDHECRNRICVNPEHVEPVTKQENIRRGMAGKINNAQSRKTHCPKGHPLSGENLYAWGGRRHCRKCRNRRLAEYRARNREMLRRKEATRRAALSP